MHNVSDMIGIFLKSGGNWTQAGEMARAQRLISKAAVGGTGMDDLRGDFATVVEAEFLESLASGPGVYDRLKPFTRRAALRAPVAVAATPLTGAIVPEGGEAPVSKFSLDASALEPRKAMALAVISNTALESPFGPENLTAELKAATILATDGELMDVLTADADTTESASSDPLTDLKKLFDGVNLTGSGNLFFITSPDTANILSTKRAGTGGPLLFPRATPTGGEVLGVPLLVTPAAGTSLLLVDAGAVVTADDNVQISLSNQAPLSMVGEPDSSGESDIIVSLFQADSTGVLATRAFSAKLVRTSGAAVLTGPAAAWGA